tara:strand:- start:1262 stop:1618 length:357 start_codon:yes stop_codon:yes gene_type:complete
MLCKNTFFLASAVSALALGVASISHAEPPIIKKAQDTMGTTCNSPQMAAKSKEGEPGTSVSASLWSPAGMVSSSMQTEHITSRVDNQFTDWTRVGGLYFGNCDASVKKALPRPSNVTK